MDTIKDNTQEIQFQNKTNEITNRQKFVWGEGRLPSQELIDNLKETASQPLVVSVWAIDVFMVDPGSEH
jgi:hypothetical protein